MKTRFYRRLSVLFWFCLSALPVAAQVDLAGYGSSPYVFQVSANSFHWGDTMQVQFYLTDLGSSAYAGTFNVGFYLSRDTTITNSDDYLLGKLPWNTANDCGAPLPGYMIPGYVYGLTVTIPLPSINPFTGSPQPTNVYVAMWVDCDNQVAESNKKLLHGS